MNRDSIKTIAGLIVIGGIVVATFLYGNAQRKAQLAHDQQVKQQQEAKASPSAIASATATPKPTASATATPSVSNNTAPVNSPASNGVQGGASPAAPSATATPAPTPTPTPTPSATPTPAVAAATPTPAAVAGAATVPQTGGTGAPLPQTGPEMAGMLGLGALGVTAAAYRRSRQALLRAARTRR